MEYTAQEVYGDTLKLRAVKASCGEILSDIESSPPEYVAVDSSSLVHIIDNIAQSDGWESDRTRIVAVNIEDAQGNALDVFKGGWRVRERIRARCDSPAVQPVLGFS